jgi:proline iminopeptidase
MRIHRGIVIIAVFLLEQPAAAPRVRHAYIHTPAGSLWTAAAGAGRGAPLLCVHGGPGAGTCALLALAPLGDERRVLFYDQLDSGRSQRTRSPALWTVDRFVRELAYVRETLGLDTVHLLGHSWGATLVARYLIDHGSGGVRSAILSSPMLSAAKWRRDALRRIRSLPPAPQALLLSAYYGGRPPPGLRAAVNAYDTRFVCRAKTGWRCEFSFNHGLYELMWGRAECLMHGTLRDFECTGRLDRIAAPVLLIAGDHDEVRLETILEYQSLLPRADYALIPNASHTAMIEQPHAYEAAIRAFLRRHDPRQEPLSRAERSRPGR